jgi:hypothetical protein
LFTGGFGFGVLTGTGVSTCGFATSSSCLNHLAITLSFSFDLVKSNTLSVNPVS